MFSSGAFLAELEVVFDRSADLHLDLLVHFLPESVLVTHHDEKAHSEQPGQSKNEEHQTDHSLVSRRS